MYISIQFKMYQYYRNKLIQSNMFPSFVSLLNSFEGVIGGSTSSSSTSSVGNRDVDDDNDND